MIQTKGSTIVALDVGNRRVGIAVASRVARLPRPLKTVEQGENIWQEILACLQAEDAGLVVIGIPRNLKSQPTGQTKTVEAFIEQLRQHVPVPVYVQDEALTSVQAEQELTRRGKPYTKGDIDALAATIILEDFLRDHPEEFQT